MFGPQVKDGGLIFFRESCFRQSGDAKRGANPTHYRNPRDYFAIFDGTEVAGRPPLFRDNLLQMSRRRAVRSKQTPFRGHRMSLPSCRYRWQRSVPLSRLEARGGGAVRWLWGQLAGGGGRRHLRQLRARQLQVRGHLRAREEEPEPDLLEVAQGAPSIHLPPLLAACPGWGGPAAGAPQLFQRGAQLCDCTARSPAAHLWLVHLAAPLVITGRILWCCSLERGFRLSF